MVVPLEDPIITETTSTLQEWGVLWKQLYVKHKVDLFHKLRHVMNELIDLRRQLIQGQLAQDQTREIKRHITVRLDWGNEHLGLDLVPRKEFEMVDPDNISVSELYKMDTQALAPLQAGVKEISKVAEYRACIQPTQWPAKHKPGSGFPWVGGVGRGFFGGPFFRGAGVGPWGFGLGCFLGVGFVFGGVGLGVSPGVVGRGPGVRVPGVFLWGGVFWVSAGAVGGPGGGGGGGSGLGPGAGAGAFLGGLGVRGSGLGVGFPRFFGAPVRRRGFRVSAVGVRASGFGRRGLGLGRGVLGGARASGSGVRPGVGGVWASGVRGVAVGGPPGLVRRGSGVGAFPGGSLGGFGFWGSARAGLGVGGGSRGAGVGRGCVGPGRGSRVLGPGFGVPGSGVWGGVPPGGDTRNDLYLTLERGDFERGGKSVQKNIEVTVYVLYADGDTLKDCISLGSGEPNTSEHRSFVLYHNNSPRWSEMIKLPIPIDHFRGSHLRFEFRHCSTKDKGEKKLFGFAFTPLMREDGTTLSDESHELYVYKCDENATFSNQGLYLSMPCCKEDFNSCPNLPSTLPFQRNPKETFWVSTQLCSTKLTQNVDLLALLNWKAHPDRVLDILGRLRHINGEDIVKVFIINLLRDSRFYHFRPVMEAYIQNHFAGALAYKELIRCLKWYMDRSAEVVRQDHIQEAMRALEYLLKFIIQSRILYSRATCGMEEELFRASIQELFQSIRFVLSLDSRSSETLVFTQAALLNSFPDIFDELLQMFTVQEVAEYVRGTLGSMPSTVDIGQSMDVVKLQSIARTVESRLFFFPESRSILLPESSVQEEVEMMVESLLDVLLQTLLSIMSKSQSLETARGQRCPQCTAEITGEYVSTLLSLLRQMTEVHFHHLLNNFHSKEELKEFLLKIFCVFRNLMKLTIFPRDWSVMRLLTSHVIVVTTQYLSPALQKNFSEVDFDFKVWNSFFSLTVLMWQKLGENKPHFIPGMMGPFLGVTLVPQSEVRNIMIPIFHDMMDWEQRQNGNFKLVEAELMDKLESMVSDGKGDVNHRELFGLLLLEKIEQETWRETGISFVTSCMKGDEMENKKMGGSSNLMNFYKSEVNKEEMYIRYIHKLCDLHLQAEDYTEAAFTLLLYWELLHWEDRPLREFLHYPTQSEWQRKEGLSRKCWEYGISLCRELAFQYETLYDYQSLSWIRNKEFVCRGYDYERLEDFQQRMLGEFPQAIAMQHPNQPDDALLQSDAQYLQIYAVTPVSDITDVPQLERVPERIKSFYRINNVTRFHFDRPFHKGPKDKENEFRSLWIERTTLILSRPLPGISRWAEVERRELVEVSPLENAIYVVENKTQELRTLISQYQHRQHHGNINPLSMLLNGDYINSQPEDAERITQLNDLMQEQVHILGVGLAVHEKLVHPEMRVNSTRGILTTHSHMSPESVRLINRHSPMNMQCSIRQSSSSLSSHTSSEAGGNLVILTDGLMGEPHEDMAHMQPSPSSSSLSSIRSTSSQINNSAPSSARGSPSLPDKAKHNREVMILLPPHQRANNTMYYSVTDNGQSNNLQRALLQQVSPCKPCIDPHMGLPEKVSMWFAGVPPVFPSAPSSWSLDAEGRETVPYIQGPTGGIIMPPVPPRSFPPGHFLMHFDAFHHQNSDPPPALPIRALRKSPLHPIPGSPTSPQSALGGSNSTLSGSASSGVSSLSESNFGGQYPDPPVRNDAMEPVPSHLWTPDEYLDSPYLHIHYSGQEAESLDQVRPFHYRNPVSHPHPHPHSHPQTAGLDGHPHPNSHPHSHTQPAGLDGHPHPHSHMPTHHQIPLHGPHRIPYRRPQPPAVPPKPYLREGCIPEEDLSS
ncbi:unnamed protein product, partial [Coregonus sp. 'balchen']